jgi:hypothetical protein
LGLGDRRGLQGARLARGASGVRSNRDRLRDNETGYGLGERERREERECEKRERKIKVQ